MLLNVEIGIFGAGRWLPFYILQDFFDTSTLVATSSRPVSLLESRGCH